MMQHTCLHILHKIVDIRWERQPQPSRLNGKGKPPVIVCKQFLHHRVTVPLLVQCDFRQTLALFDHAVIIVLHPIIQTHGSQILTIVERVTPQNLDRLRKFHTD